MCRGAIHRSKLNTLVSGKLRSVCVLFQEGGIHIGSVLAVFIVTFLPPAVLHLLYMWFFLLLLLFQIRLWQRDTVTFSTLWSFVLARSMYLFLVRRQLHKMMRRTLRGLGGIIFGHSSQQSCSFLTVRNNWLYCAPQGQMWHRLQLPPGWRKSCKCVHNIVFRWQAPAFCVIQPIEKTISR